jgi:hypothetical protein
MDESTLIVCPSTIHWSPFMLSMTPVKTTSGTALPAPELDCVEHALRRIPTRANITLKNFIAFMFASF